MYVVYSIQRQISLLALHCFTDFHTYLSRVWDYASPWSHCFSTGVCRGRTDSAQHAKVNDIGWHPIKWISRSSPINAGQYPNIFQTGTEDWWHNTNAVKLVVHGCAAVPVEHCRAYFGWWYAFEVIAKSGDSNHASDQPSTSLCMKLFGCLMLL